MIYKSDDLFPNLGLLYWPFIKSCRIPFGHLLILLSLEENDSREFKILRCARNRGSMYAWLCPTEAAFLYNADL